MGGSRLGAVEKFMPMYTTSVAVKIHTKTSTLQLQVHAVGLLTTNSWAMSSCGSMNVQLLFRLNGHKHSASAQQCCNTVTNREEVNNA